MESNTLKAPRTDYWSGGKTNFAMRGASGEWKVTLHPVFSFTLVTALVQPCSDHEVIN